MVEKKKQKTILITGAAGGLGRCLSNYFVQEGMNIAAIDINKAGLESLKKEVEKADGKIICFALDILDFRKLKETVDLIEKKWGTIDILINSAGTNNKKPLEELTQKDIDSVIDINLKGYIYTTRLVAPIMMRSKEFKYIFNISSMAGTRGLNSNGIYHASKFGVNGFSNSMSKYLIKHNINVVNLCPGAIKTSWWTNKYKWAFNNELLIEPGEIAELIKFIMKGRKTTLYQNIHFFPGCVTESW